ncbi:MAG TPA: integron [Pseudorhodoplanes sp.]|nr:integron [Pseudorhodoplanes sp.]
MAFPSEAQEARIRPQVPIMVGGDPDMDACGSVGAVEGLDPLGDGFLAVKAAPSLKAARIDKLHNGKHVHICQVAGDWYGIVYGNTRQDCNVSTPWPRALPYTGPCRSGWAHKRWIRAYAG